MSEAAPPRSGSRSRPSRNRSRPRRAPVLLAAAGVLGVLALAGAAAAIEHVGVMPRTLAPYIEKRSSGHNPAIVAAGRQVAHGLIALDRGDVQPVALPALALGAQPAGVPARAGGLEIAVDSPAALRAALARAEPGTTIVLAPGTYRIAGAALDANRPGREDAPITVRAQRPGSARLEFDTVEGFRVSAPWWRFENLDIRGVCGDDAFCEHAFHVVGEANHFAAVNNAVTDFNAHFKVNGAGGRFPDDGLIASNTLAGARPRKTANPVAFIDMVGVNRWTVRANVIRDFVKDDGDRVSYGAYAKGAGSGNVFERNLVWCEQALVGRAGQRIGLSLGGGGTGKPYCRDQQCITEQQGSTLRANLVVGCSDVGIYLNSAADSRVEDNTLVDTAGIDVRFPTSSARLDGNLVDGPIRSRDGGLLHEGDNRTSGLWQSFIGMHPVRAAFARPGEGDFSWDGAAPRRAGRATGTGLCGLAREREAAYGAFDSFAACLGAPAP